MAQSFQASGSSGSFYEKFRNASREPVRLSCALDGYFAPETCAQHKEAFREYLLRHLRPALDSLVSSGRVDRILQLRMDGICPASEIETLTRRWEDPSHPAQWLQLLSLKYPEMSAAGVSLYDAESPCASQDDAADDDPLHNSRGDIPGGIPLRNSRGDAPGGIPLRNSRGDAPGDIPLRNSRGNDPGGIPLRNSQNGDPAVSGAAVMHRCLMNLYSAFPFLDGAIGALPIREISAAASLFSFTDKSTETGRDNTLSDPSGITIATDGCTLYYSEVNVLALWKMDPPMLRRCIFHLLLHCLLGHLWPDPEPAYLPDKCKDTMKVLSKVTPGNSPAGSLGKSPADSPGNSPAGSPGNSPAAAPEYLPKYTAENLWHAAADLSVEFLIEQNCRRHPAMRSLLGSLPIPGNWISLFSKMEGAILPPDRILREVPRQTLQMLAPEMKRDDHSLWASRQSVSRGPSHHKAQQIRQLRRMWHRIAQDALWQETLLLNPDNGSDSNPPPRSLSSPGKSGSGSAGEHFPGASGFGIGSFPGDETLPAGIIAKSSYDYRSFLHRFSVFREEMQSDPDSFDQVYYTLGMERYGNLPLIEPLEYREGFKLEELVIAIDTSGSCKTPTVLRFLEETRSILEEKENFFPHMNVWILQCDCIVQSAVHIRSREDWDEYLRTLEITGRSGTDFRPVFRYIEKLQKEGALSNLKALIYFTDGDGVYPREAPEYETAFVFVEEPAEGLHTPAWARKLIIPVSS